MKHTKFKHSTCALAVSAAIGGFALPSMAQDAGPEQARVLESIEVTARRTVENLQQVPLSVTSLGEAEIETREACPPFWKSSNFHPIPHCRKAVRQTPR
jgi:iron complex outermembrane recepter protein